MSLVRKVWTANQSAPNQRSVNLRAKFSLKDPRLGLSFDWF